MARCGEQRQVLPIAFWRAIGGAVFTASFMPAAGFAQEWVTLPTISTVVTYDSNPQLSSENETPNKAYRLNPSIVSRLELPTSAVDISASATFTRSDDQQIQNDADEYNLGGAYERTFETSIASAELDLSFEEFANSDFDDDQDLSAVDSVQANDDDTILTTGLLLNYDLELSDLYSMTNSVDITQTEFSDDARTDFRDTRADFGLDYAYSEVTTIGAELGVQYFEPDGLDTVEVARISGLLNEEFGDNHSLSIQAGIAATDERISYTLDASYAHPFEEFDVVTTVSNDVSADDNGELNEVSGMDVTVTHPYSEFTNIQTSLALSRTDTTEAVLWNGLLSHDYSEDVRASLSASYRFSENSGGIVDTETQQAVLAPSVTWTVNEEFNAVVRYDEIHQIDQDDTRVDNRRGTITLNYNLPPF